MILGVTTESWIESLSLKEQDRYLDLVDNIIIVTNTDKESEPPFYFVKGIYSEVTRLLKELAICKAYPQRTWFSTNYALVEITEGLTPDKLRRNWVNELQRRNLV